VQLEHSIALRVQKPPRYDRAEPAADAGRRIFLSRLRTRFLQIDNSLQSIGLQVSTTTHARQDISPHDNHITAAVYRNLRFKASPAAAVD
jgi:hypothetical protein